MEIEKENRTKTISIIAIFIAMSIILSYVKIMGSIALDQVPAFLIFLIYKDKKSSVISSMSHLISAFLAGFPFTIFTHILIALGMFLMFYLAVPILKHTNKYFALMFLGIVNSFVLTFIVFIFIPFDMTTYITICSALLFASVINITCALLLEKPIKKII